MAWFGQKDSVYKDGCIWTRLSDLVDAQAIDMQTKQTDSPQAYLLCLINRTTLH